MERLDALTERLKAIRADYGERLSRLAGTDEPDCCGAVADGLDVHAFPVDVLPTALRNLVTAGAAAIHCPPELIAAPALVMAGAAIGLSRVLRVKSRRLEPPLLWLATVARSAEGKSPALEYAAAPVRAAQGELYAAYRREKERYQAMPAKERDGPPPRLEHVLTTDATIEAVGRVLLDSPRGIVLVRDELTAWTLGMNAYKQNKGGDRQHWLSIHSLASILVDRVSRDEPTYVSQPFVAVVGGLQPDVLGDLMPEGQREDGFLARMLFSYPMPLAPKVSHAEPDAGALNDWHTLVNQLYALQETMADDGTCRPQEVGWGVGGHAAWVTWCHEHDAERGAPDFPDTLKAAWGKFDMQLARIALIIHLMRLESGETEDEGVDAESMAAAVEVVRYFKSHARKVYGHLGARAGVERQARAVLLWLQRQPKRRGKLRDLCRATVAGIRSREESAPVVARLEADGLARLVTDHGQGGASQVLELIAPGGEAVTASWQLL